MEREMEQKKKGKEEKREHTGAWMDMIQKSPGFLDYIARNCLIDETRMSLLQKILLSEEYQEKEEEIYLYGSLLRGKDLIGRQIFLWLLGMTEEMKRNRGEE